MTNISASLLNEILERFGQQAAIETQRVVHTAFPGGWLPPAVVMALGLRETNLQNICGGAKLVEGKWVPTYTDRGWLQITDTIAQHRQWLSTRPGCPNGAHNKPNWDPDMVGYRTGGEHKITAATAMHCPTMTAALQYTLSTIKSDRAQAEASKVAPEHVLQLVVAAHNAGFFGALQGYQAGDIDKNTTLGNYSSDVLEHAPAIAAWIAAKPNWQWKGVS